MYLQNCVLFVDNEHVVFFIESSLKHVTLFVKTYRSLSKHT